MNELSGFQRNCMELKTKVADITEKNSMTALIKNAESTFSEIESFQAQKVPQFKAKESNFTIGSFTFENFLARGNEQEDVSSDPIVVDGHIFCFELFPNGWGEEAGTYISAGIRR